MARASSKEEVSKLCAEALFLAMDQLPKGQWVHGSEFLPANVTTDTHGINRFKKMLADIVKLVLDSEGSSDETGVACPTCGSHLPAHEVKVGDSLRPALKANAEQVVHDVARRAAALIPSHSDGGEGPTLEINLKASVQLCAPHGKDWLTCPECAKAAGIGDSSP